MAGCTEEQRAACIVYRNFRNNPGDMENISCWILKRGDPAWTDADNEKCLRCNYYDAINRRHGVTVSYGANDTVIIECSGSMNMQRAQALSEIADKLKAQGKGRVAINLAEVTNIYSSALSMMVRLHLQCEELGGTFVMAGAAGYAKVAIDAVSIYRIVKCVETMEEALALIGGK
jgi:anti-anti-sigma factor